MTTSQRGSVLLTVIAGLVLLALLGSAMLTLMTGSVMTGVDGREAMQAAYLAESGKEIVRVQTEKLDGGGLMGEAIDLETAGPISIDGKGGVKLQLFPSWFRWTGEELKSTDSGWYGGTPKGTHDWLEISKDGATRYRIDNVNAVKNDTFGSEAADLYLIGRVSGENGITYDAANNTLTVKTTENDLEWFPNSGGLIGLVSQAGKDTPLPAAAQVSTHRFTYDQKTSDKGTYTFTNVTRLSSSPLSTDTFKGKDIALGQYFRVLSTGRTLNDAQAALVWHTNGRGSLRSGNASGESGNGEVQELPEVSSPLKNKHDAEELFDDNRFGHFETATDKKGLLVQGYGRATPDHFLNTRKNDTTYDSWFAGITEETIAETPRNDILIQTSVIPWYQLSANLFAGILFRTHFIPKPGDDDDDELTSYGVSGLGMGVVSGEITTNAITYPTAPGMFATAGSGVTRSPVNPALLPGGYKTISPYQSNYPATVRQPNVYIPDDPSGTYQSLYTNAAGHTLRDGIVLWYADDGKEEHALNCLAYSIPEEKVLKKNSTTTLVVRVWEQDNKNYVQGWIAFQNNNNFMNETYWPSLTDSEPQNDVSRGQQPTFRRILWGYVNPALAAKIDDYTIATSQGLPVPGVHNHAGIFAGAYSSTPETPDGLVFRHFKVGIPGSNGVEDDSSSGLTPGIVQ